MTAQASRSPALALDGFNGPLAELLILARTQRIDLARLSLPDLLDRLAGSAARAGPGLFF